jgi:hypothetical protein
MSETETTARDYLEVILEDITHTESAWFAAEVRKQLALKGYSIVPTPQPGAIYISQDRARAICDYSFIGDDWREAHESEALSEAVSWLEDELTKGEAIAASESDAGAIC